MSTKSSNQPMNAGTEVGTAIDQVVLEIDYAIIEHFSQHLYGSPNKAVEELVANSFDAFATVAYVYIPGPHVQGRLAVWDDGTSMDVEGLKQLWWIARSPKDGGERVETARGRTRKLIGKFGIGKLASYAVGERISHLCKHDGRFLLVGVDYRDVETELTGEGLASRYVAPIRELTEEEALAWAEGVFVAPCEAREKLWGAETFTLAVVDELRNVPLTPGRLRWVLGNGMPLRPDFRVWVNDEPVEPRLARGAKTRWNLGEKKVQQSLANAWEEAVRDHRVSGTFVDGEPQVSPTTGEVEPVIVFPELGSVRAELALFEKSLQRQGETRDERSYGFFVMVRDRLLNVEDAQLFLPDPSFGTFYRAQFIIRADALDEDLLADRGRLRENPRTRELAVLQHALYRAARAELERQDEERAGAEGLVTLLPTSSRDLFRSPLTALLVHENELAVKDFDFEEPRISREDLLEDEPIAVVDPEGQGFKVNVAHPFFDAVREQVGSGKAAERALRAFDLFAVSERLLEGYLYDIGLPDEQVAQIMSWRDRLFRAFAPRYLATPEDLIAEVWNASHKGRRRFEDALEKLFNLTGFVAVRRGASGDEDVLVVGPTGETASKFIVEGKGSKHPLPNDKAEIAGAASHCKQAKASVALVVAREFAGFSKGEDPAVLRECRAVSTADCVVSIVDVQSLVDLYHAVHQYSYPLDVILPALAEIEAPSAKRERIAKLASPVEHFDYRALLEELWRRQQEEAAGDVVAYRHVWQVLYKDAGLSLDEFTSKLVALDTLSPGLVRLDTTAKEVTLLQRPDIIAQHIQRSLEQVSSDAAP